MITWDVIKEEIDPRDNYTHQIIWHQKRWGQSPDKKITNIGQEPHFFRIKIRIIGYIYNDVYSELSQKLNIT